MFSPLRCRPAALAIGALCAVLALQSAATQARETDPKPGAQVATAVRIAEDNTLLAWSPKGDQLLCVVSDRLIELPGRRTISLLDNLGGVEYLRWNSSGTRFVLGDKETAVVVDYAAFRIAKVVERATTAWWSEDHQVTLYQPYDGAAVVKEGEQKYVLPADLNVTAASDDGRYLLARVYDEDKVFEEAGSIRLIRYLGSGRIEPSKNLVPGMPLTKLPYGDFIVTGGGKEILLGHGDTTARDKTINMLYYYRLGNKRARPIWKPWYSYGLLRPAWDGKRFVGVRRDDQNRINKPPKPSKYFEFTLMRRNRRQKKLDAEVIAFALQRNTSNKAYILREPDGGAVLRAWKDGRLWLSQRLDELLR